MFQKNELTLGQESVRGKTKIGTHKETYLLRNQGLSVVIGPLGGRLGAVQFRELTQRNDLTTEQVLDGKPLLAARHRGQ
jgi:hypothetical protein